MQLDFHHGVTYVVARLAGLTHNEASIVAYCAQYVDDATNSGLIRFQNGALFSRISSAHKLLDYRNFKELAVHHVWIPFHFLPANCGLPAGQEPEGEFVDRLICRPNSLVAQQMVKGCIEDKYAPYGLHRLGITLHVYADTWAHQGFAGVNHRINEVTRVTDAEGKLDRSLVKRLAGYFISEALPLGHGAALSYPDRPFLRWGYTNGRGDRILRDNPKDFLEAADHLCQAIRRYQLGDAEAQVVGLLEPDKTTIAYLLQNITDDDKFVRHQKWLKAIAEGKFSFGRAKVSYISKGKGSWKYLSLGTEKAVDSENETFPYQTAFLNSDWKRFHDALQAHHFHVLHELLPQYGICTV
ncbi:MAG: hypothetical protein KME11_19795 [Timaviella obliquedivisa GSE-PSE-MK23-08B]|jgi:hypothetical protein|nr:hypothetical protein [Timaviella obliquedivisa GSE-PSE-MK23-08B]